MPGNVTADLIRALVENMEDPSGMGDDWESIAMILEFPEGAFNSAHGYAYSPDGISAVAADPWAVTPAVKAYTDGYYEDGDALPLKLLVQFERTTGRYNVTFEDSDETRWKVTPKNFRQLREELRPTFD